MRVTDDGGRKLRVGLFADSPLQPRWMVESFAAIAALGFADLLVIEDCGAGTRRMPWLWRAYSRVDTSLFGSRPDPSERVDLRTSIPGAAWLALPALESGSAIEDWRAALAALRLDVAFALGSVDGDALADAARYGVWRFCFGEDYAPLDAVAGFREMSAGAPVTTSGLRVSRGRGPDRLVYRSWSRTIPYSLAQNRRRFLVKTGAFAARALRRLHEAGGDWLDGCAPLARVPFAASNGLPGVLEITRGLSRTGRRIARRALQRLLTVEQWFIAYRFGHRGPWTGDLSGFMRLLPPRDRYWADPFALERNGRHYIFFEDFPFATAKGRIAAVEVDRGGSCSEPVPVLECKYHLSYPFLLEHDGQLFMIPETVHNRTVELYRCIDFPGRWRLEKVLLRGACFADATVHRVGDRWWMFANIGMEAGAADDELHLYHADHLFGEWTPHRDNPVKSDTRCARPAGRLFERDGQLYRPTQICAPLYGSGICINRIGNLTPEAYHEEEVERMLPSHSAGLLGIHTVNSAGELSVVDGFMRRRRAWQGGGGAAEPVRAPGVAAAESPGP